MANVVGPGKPLVSASVGVEGLRRSFQAADIDERRASLSELVTGSEEPAVRHELAALSYLAFDFAEARRHAESAFLQLKARGERRAAAVTAALLGRIYFEGLDNKPLANGWFGRARTMLEGEGPCPERGWVLLGLVGCSVENPAQLSRDCEEALAIARSCGDSDLECKALADGGLASISLGRVEQGLVMVDEAMAMVSCGEVGYFAAHQVLCDAVTACERSGDVGRLESWLDVLDGAGVARPDDRRPVMFSHCHTAYGTVLCRAGRWREAEGALRLGAATSREGFGYHRIGGRAALAELRIRQGRADEAAMLLEKDSGRVEAAYPLALLHQSVGRHEDAVSVATRALRDLGVDDGVRSVPLLALEVRSRLALGDMKAAAEAAAELERRTAGHARNPRRAYAALAHAEVHRSTGDVSSALEHLEHGLGLLVGARLPLLEAELRLTLAETVETSDSPLAEAEARAALDLFASIGAPEAVRCRLLLVRLGRPAPDIPPSVSPLDELSGREREVLGLLGRGRSNPEIAAELFISRKTVEHHVGAVLRKLGLRNRTEAAAYAVHVAAL
jgi:ATP/maltotriose-dependent transcriptional regulator MalT